MNYPQDAIKDRFEGPHEDSCPDCLHAKDECVCEPEKDRSFEILKACLPKFHKTYKRRNQ